jgi:hypothetical protein
VRPLFEMSKKTVTSAEPDVPVIPAVDTTTLAPSEKLAVVQAEVEVKQLALRDTLASNEALQRKIRDLHKQQESAKEHARAAVVDLEEAKKRQTLQRYYRRRAEEDQKKRKSLLLGLHDDERTAAAMRRGAGKSTTAFASSTTPSPLFDANALDELRVMVADTVERVEAARAKRDRIARALHDVTALRLKMETATSRQLRHTESLAVDLSATKHNIAKEIVLTATENRDLRAVEKEVAAAQRRCDGLAADVKDASRHAQRILFRLKSNDKNVGSLQNTRATSRINAESEAVAAETRDAAVAALRKENAALIQWLLDDTPSFIDEAERERIQAAAREEAVKLAAHKVRLQASLGLPEHGGLPDFRKPLDPREQRLFNDLEEAIRKTRANVGASGR